MRFFPVFFISFLSVVIAKPLGDFPSQSYPTLSDNILAPNINGNEDTISGDKFPPGIGAPAIPNILTYLPGGYRDPTVPDTIGITDSDWTTEGTLVAQKHGSDNIYEAMLDSRNERTCSGEGSEPCNDGHLGCCNLVFPRLIDNLSTIVHGQCKADIEGCRKTNIWCMTLQAILLTHTTFYI